MSLKKKGERRRVEDYKSVTRLNRLYKINTIVLERRLEKEIEERKLLPAS